MTTLSEAFAFLEGCRFWSLSPYAMSCSYEAPRPKTRAEAQGWEPLIRTGVRRGKAESLEDMVIRCAAKAAERRSVSWRSCQACGSRSGVQAAPQVKLALCRVCRSGIGETVSKH